MAGESEIKIGLAEAPALLNVDQAFDYLGRHRGVLFALVEQRYLEPIERGHKRTKFLREDIDAALRAAKRNRASLTPTAGVKSVAGALAIAEASERKEGGRR